MKSDWHAIAPDVFQICAQHGRYLEVQWIPRIQIERADFISRLIDIDDWQLTWLLTCFENLETRWSPHTFDCFANYF